MFYHAGMEVIEVSENKITSDLLRGHTDTMILRLLSEADRYGYEIVKLIADRSGGEYELKEATMYFQLPSARSRRRYRVVLGR